MRAFNYEQARSQTANECCHAIKLNLQPRHLLSGRQ